ncbi:FAR1-related sequence 1, partial [Striga asiatica]
MERIQAGRTGTGEGADDGRCRRRGTPLSDYAWRATGGTDDAYSGGLQRGRLMFVVSGLRQRGRCSDRYGVSDDGGETVVVGQNSHYFEPDFPISHEISVPISRARNFRLNRHITYSTTSGQRFRELHEAVNFYKTYALTVGFDVRHSTLAKARDKTGYKQRAVISPTARAKGH